VPLVTYLGVTVVAPALNGSGREPAFWEHATITLGVAGLLSLPWLLIARRAARPEQVTPRGSEPARHRRSAPRRNE
jgi:hypothetical protein